ncbi:hypothetical protein Ahy_B10g101745 [Arachis hypogaea]|uniref:Transposase MuDR plant domain-containing protein n=1 Tax=Arachis hypogaea TaxID=3818 RepID=A0A444X0H9_ARAHY|nr:hypothetical protein Ahy_B10g101745 [Arachis hypogaea]
MRTPDLEAMHAPDFFEYANMGNIAAEDGEFSVGIEFGSRESVISAIKSYTISRGVDYTVYESKPQTFYAKCKGYGVGCDWLIRASLIQKKACWEIRKNSGKHTCTMGTISQDHAMLDSDTIADAIRPRATKGRPKSTCYLNEMDSRDMRGLRRCTICGREGHSLADVLSVQVDLRIYLFSRRQQQQQQQQ